MSRRYMLDNRDIGHEVERVWAGLLALNREIAQYYREKRQRGFLMSGCLVMLGACSLCAAESNTDGVPFVTWTSRSGNGPFTELRSEKFVSAGWLKWLGEAHKLYCDIDVNRGEEYSMRISMPPNMCLTHVSCSREFSWGLTSCDQDLDWWCTVRRKKDCAEIVIWPSQCRRMELRLGFHEGAFGSWGSIRMDETPKRTFVVDDTASEYDWNQKVHKTLSARPCSTPMEAARIAEGIFLRTYKKNLYSERPWRVTDTNGCYLVTGSLPKGHRGGVSQLKLRKSDGFVWLYYHGK